jgi:O-antigen ligase
MMTSPIARGLLETGLVACLLAAPVAIGGTQPLVWAGIKFAIFLMTAAAIWVLPKEFAALPWKWFALLSTFLVVQAFILHARGERAGDPMADFLVYPAAFALAAAVAAGAAARARLLAALIVLGALEALYGLAQELAGWQQILGMEKFVYRSQATGTYVNPNHFSGLLEMILPLALATAAWRWDNTGRHSGKTGLGEGRAAAVFFAALAMLIAAGILVSHSRMGLVSATAGAALAAGLWTCRAERPQRRRRAAALAGALMALALLALWIGTQPAVERFRQINQDSASRIDLWRESWPLVRERPLFGAGWGAYPRLYPQVQATQLEFAVEHAHNDYLELATEFGIPGAALLVFLAAGVALRALTRRRLQDRAAYQALGAACGIAALGVHSIADFNLRLPANALIFSALLGMAWAAAAPQGIVESPAPRKSFAFAPRTMEHPC